MVSVPLRDQISTIQIGTWFGMSRMIIIKFFIFPNSKNFHFVMAQGSQKGEAGGSGGMSYFSGQNLN